MAGNCSTTSASYHYIRVIVIFCAVPVTLSYAWMSSENDKMYLPCETPRNKDGICVEIRYCKQILNLLNNKRARKFIRKSRCGSRSDPRNIKVCCESRHIFRNPTNTENNNDILPKNCGQQRITIENRIIGGKEAAVGEYPWMARLIHRDEDGFLSFGCSAFLIHPHFVVTAAHCTQAYRTPIKGSVHSVTLAEHDIDKEFDCLRGTSSCIKSDEIKVATVIAHPDFMENKVFYNDIAIIKLQRKARFSRYVQPICLPRNDSNVPSRYYLNGWGKTEKELTSRRKIKVEVPSFDKDECRKKYSAIKVHLKDTQICAGGEEDEDACVGDSGGPLMMYSDEGIWYASGVVSFGISCGMDGWPGVYTNIAKFLPWIESEMRKHLN